MKHGHSSEEFLDWLETKMEFSLTDQIEGEAIQIVPFILEAQSVAIPALGQIRAVVLERFAKIQAL